MGRFGGEAGYTGGEPGLRGNGDLGATFDYSVVDLVGGAIGRGCEDGRFGGELKPALLFFRLAGVVRVDLAAGAHEARADCGDVDSLVAKFRVKTLRVAYEGELAGYVGKQVGHGEFPSNAGDIDDGGVAVDGISLEQMREGGIGGVEGREEIGGHGALVGGDRLVFDGADFDDASVVDEDVDVAVKAGGVVDEHGGLSGVGEVGGEEEDIVRMLDGVVCEESVAGLGELVRVAGDEDEFCSGAAKAVCESETEAPGAAGDENDPAAVELFVARHEGAGSGYGGESNEDLGGVKCGSGGLHSCR